MIDFSFTETKTNTEKILKTKTIQKWKWFHKNYIRTKTGKISITWVWNIFVLMY